MLRRAWIAALGISLSLTAPAADAFAEGVICPDDGFYDRATKTCSISVTVAGTAGSGAQQGLPAVVDSGGTVSACMNDIQNEPVACESASGWWSNERQCYVQLMDPQPVPGHVLWEGRTDGAIYLCTYSFGFAVMPLPFWSDWDCTFNGVTPIEEVPR